FGELWHLRELLQRSPDALSIWTGPLKRPHDFTAAGGDMEVKTTLSRDHWIFQIHGVDQLQPPAGGVLYLSALQLEQVADSGESVPELLDALHALGADPREMLEKLLAAGYDSRDSDFYRQ